MSLQGPPFQAFPGHHTGVPLLQLNLRTSTVGGGGGEPESRHRVDGKLQVAAPGPPAVSWFHPERKMDKPSLELEPPPTMLP